VFFAGTDGLTTSTSGTVPTTVIGVILQGVERHLLVDARVDDVIRRDHPDRQAVLRRIDDLHGARHAAGAGGVLDDDRVRRDPGQLVAHRASDDVDGRAGRQRDDDAKRLLGLRARDRGAGGQRQGGKNRGAAARESAE
jgi:hypothetical protein